MHQFPEIGSTVAGRYTIDREIGRGGMATVYRARDSRLERIVALKVVRPEVIGSAGAERFAREIALTAGLEHPHILPVLDSGVANGVPFYVMPFVEGETLRDRLRRDHVLPIDVAVRMAHEVADALSHAHARGIIHRDIKPENLLLAEGHIRVADFGIARRMATGETLTAPGAALGTLHYMSPEQLSADGALDGRSDLYALGCVLFESLTGSPPFHATSIERVVTMHLLESPPDVRAARPGVSAELAAVIARCLAKSPSDRFPSAEALAEALLSIDGRSSGDALDRSVRSHRESRPRLLMDRLRRTGRVGALLVILAITLAAPLVRGWLASTADSADGAALPRWVLIADLEGPPDDPTLARAIRDLVAIGLEGSGRYARVPDHEIRGARVLAEVPDSAALTMELARQLAYRKSVPIVIGGSVSRVAAGRLALTLRAVSVDDGRTIGSTAAESSDDDLIGPASRLGVALLRQLPRSEAGGRTESRPAVRTASFDAYRLLVDARAHADAGEHGPASSLARQAIAKDSLFASAWLTLWNSWRNASNDSTPWAAARLEAITHRLSASEQALFDAYRSLGTSDALPRWERLAEADPLNAAAHNGVGVLRANRRRLEDAERSLAQAVALSPLGAPPALHLMNHAQALFALDRADEGSRVASRTSGQIRAYLSIAEAISRRDWDRVERDGTAFASNAGHQVTRRITAALAVASAHAGRCRVQEALRTLDQARAMSRDLAAWDSELIESMLVLHRAAGTRPVGSPPWRGDSANPSLDLVAGLWSAVTRDTVTALARLARVETRWADSAQLLGELDLLRASIADARGDSREVIRQLAESSNEGGAWFPTIHFKRLLAADALLSDGRPDSAIVVLERVAGGRQLNFGERFLLGLPLAFAHERLGRAHLARGDRTRAAEHLRTFLAMCAGADPSLTTRLEEARATHRELAPTR